ncbi:MAG: signal peptidase I [bacterium]
MPFCIQCGNELKSGSYFCDKCGAKNEFDAVAVLQSGNIKTLNSNRSGFIAVLVTVLLGTGIGHMYAGFLLNGILLFAISMLLASCLFTTFAFLPNLGPIVLLLVIAIWLYPIIDAGMKAKKGTIKKYNRWYYYIIGWIIIVVISNIFTTGLKRFIIQSYMIPTPSMVPTILPNDRVMGNRLIYRFSDPKHGDIIAFKPPFASSEKEESGFSIIVKGERVVPYLKRVIAVGGDTIEVRNGIVYVNNVPLDEPYINEKPNYDYPPVKVPKDNLFVMGDNRSNSHDSHVWGFVPKENVQAKIIFRFWPIRSIGPIRTTSITANVINTQVDKNFIEIPTGESAIDNTLGSTDIAQNKTSFKIMTRPVNYDNFVKHFSSHDILKSAFSNSEILKKYYKKTPEGYFMYSRFIDDYEDKHLTLYNIQQDYCKEVYGGEIASEIELYVAWHSKPDSVLSTRYTETTGSCCLPENSDQLLEAEGVGYYDISINNKVSNGTLPYNISGSNDTFAVFRCVKRDKYNVAEDCPKCNPRWKN